MKTFCFACGKKDEELEALRKENSNMRAVVAVVRRAVSEVKIDSIEEMGTLNLERAERLLVIEAIERSEGNRNIAAEMLGIARSTLFEMLKRHGIKSTARRQSAVKGQT